MEWFLVLWVVGWPNQPMADAQCGGKPSRHHSAACAPRHGGQPVQPYVVVRLAGGGADADAGRQGRSERAPALRAENQGSMTSIELLVPLLLLAMAVRRPT